MNQIPRRREDGDESRGGFERRAQIFPRLTAAQVERIAEVGSRRAVKAGESVFEVGDRATDFFVVVAGELEVVRPRTSGEWSVTYHGPGEFTGEINMLSGRRALVGCRVASDGELIVVDRERLRVVVQRDAQLSEILMRAFILRRAALIAQGGGGLVLVGSRHSAQTMVLREFLTRNAQPFLYQDVETEPDVQELLERFRIRPQEIPVVVSHGGAVMRNPSIECLAEELGLSLRLDPAVVRDLVVVGAGPAGLAAAVYAASEGLDVLVLEGKAPGGQAGTSSRIENYLGFPTGISGEALSGRALTQAEKFGAEIAIPRQAARIDCDGRPYQIHLDNGDVVRTRSLIIATGARYQTPDLPELARFEGNGVYYSATHLEAQLSANEPVAVVGGGNSADQAAVFLSNVTSAVRMIVRGPGLADSMSRYLIERITGSPVITLHTRTQIEALQGENWLESVRCRDAATGATTTYAIRHLFLMTGATPHTGWLKGCLQLDAKGFIRTGTELRFEDGERPWPLARSPYLLETSIPGVFAVGDARAGSVKRVAAAVGEGSMCVQFVHQALLEQ